MSVSHMHVLLLLTFQRLLKHLLFQKSNHDIGISPCSEGGSLAKWLACWTQVQKGLGSNRSRSAVGYQS